MPAEPARKSISEAEYLALEERSEERHEFFDGQVFAMAGASQRHNQIAGNIYIALRSIRTANCRVLIADVKFKRNSRTLYPDVMVSCTPATDSHIETQPCLVIEVLSATTEAFDRGEKLHTYLATPELEAYLMVSQSERRVDVYRRAGSFWHFASVTEGRIDLPCPLGTLSLDEIYGDIDLVDAKET